MPHPHQTTASQQDKQRQPKNKPSVDGEQLGEQVAINRFVAGESTVEGQVARLSDGRLFAVQRQAMASQLGRVAGNQYLQRVMQQVMRLDEVDTGEAVGLDGGTTTTAAAAPKPTFDHSGGSTVTINADTAPQFAQNITTTIGAPHTKPEFEPDIQVDFKTDTTGKEIPGTKKISSIGLTVKSAIVKVRFGMGRVNAAHKKAIDEMVANIKAHEDAHRAIIEAEAIQALATAQKFVGTGKVKEAQKALTKDLECATNKKHEALDATEGLQTAAEQPDGSVTVTKSSSGAKYPC